MTIVKWKTRSMNTAAIERVEVLRETGRSVYYTDWSKKERRANKAGSFEQYHDSWDDAHQFLLGRAESAMVYARRSLERAQGVLGNVKGLKKPEGA
jgi:hypothetical protein